MEHIMLTGRRVSVIPSSLIIRVSRREGTGTMRDGDVLLVHCLSILSMRRRNIRSVRRWLGRRSGIFGLWSNRRVMILMEGIARVLPRSLSALKSGR